MVRIKHRYLLVHILYPTAPPASNSSPSDLPNNTILFHAPTPPHLTSFTFLQLLRSQISLLFGDYGSGVLAAGLSVKYFSPATSTAIIRCPRAHYRLAWAALTFVTELPGTEKGMAGTQCVLRVVRVSGTIRKVEEEAVRRARCMIAAVRNGGGDGGLGTLQAIFGGNEDGGGIGSMEGEEGGTSDDDG